MEEEKRDRQTAAPLIRMAQYTRTFSTTAPTSQKRSRSTPSKSSRSTEGKKHEGSWGGWGARKMAGKSGHVLTGLEKVRGTGVKTYRRKT